MQTFTAQDMKDYGDYVASLHSAMLSPNFEKWCSEQFEVPWYLCLPKIVRVAGVKCYVSKTENPPYNSEAGAYNNIEHIYGYDPDDPNPFISLGDRWPYAEPI
jgi:hypothetical protein